MQLTIVGTGKMAEAIIAGASRYHDIDIIARDLQKAKALKERYNLANIIALEAEVNISDRTVILCVKPYALKDVSGFMKGEAKMLLSVLAGTTLQELKESIASSHYVRTMPNLAASHQKSMTTLFGDEACKNDAIEICESFGNALWLNSEKEIDIATAVAGSGPAFLALVAEALADGGVKEGLKREDAMALVRGLFAGFAPLVEEKHPAILKDEVMSPGGTTAAGYAALEEGGVRNACMKAIQRAYERAKG